MYRTRSGRRRRKNRIARDSSCARGSHFPEYLVQVKRARAVKDPRLPVLFDVTLWQQLGPRLNKVDGMCPGPALNPQADVLQACHIVRRKPLASEDVVPMKGTKFAGTPGEAFQLVALRLRQLTPVGRAVASVLDLTPAPVAVPRICLALIRVCNDRGGRHLVVIVPLRPLAMGLDVFAGGY